MLQSLLSMTNVAIGVVGAAAMVPHLARSVFARLAFAGCLVHSTMGLFYALVNRLIRAEKLHFTDLNLVFASAQVVSQLGLVLIVAAVVGLLSRRADREAARAWSRAEG